MSASDRHAAFMSLLGDRLLFSPNGRGGYTDGGAAEPVEYPAQSRDTLGTGGRFGRAIRRARS